MGLEFINKLPTPEEIREQFPLPDGLAQIKAKRDEEIRKVLEEQNCSFRNAKDWIFYSRMHKEQHLSRYQAFRLIKEAAAYAGLDANISCHSLRKTFGYHAWKQGTPPALLMNIYNHSSYQITRRYLGIDQNDKDEVFEKIRL